MSGDTQQMQQLLAKLGTLERRVDHLDRQLRDNDCSPGARSFISAERSALGAAIIALRLHHAQVENLPHPVAVLRQLIDALEKRDDLDDELTELLERASVAVTEFEASEEAGRKVTSGANRLQQAR